MPDGVGSSKCDSALIPVLVQAHGLALGAAHRRCESGVDDPHAVRFESPSTNRSAAGRIQSLWKAA